MCCSVIQCVAVKHYVLQCVAMRCVVLCIVTLFAGFSSVMQCSAVCCSNYCVMQFDAIRCIVLCLATLFAGILVCCSVMQWVAEYHCVLQRVAMRCIVLCIATLFPGVSSVLQCNAVFCNVLLRVTVCYNVLYRVVHRDCVAVCCSVLQYVAVCCSVAPCIESTYALRYVAMCFSVLQCVAAYCSMLQRVAVWYLVFRYWVARLVGSLKLLVSFAKSPIEQTMFCRDDL